MLSDNSASEFVGNDFTEKNLLETDTAWYPQDGENIAPIKLV